MIDDFLLGPNCTWNNGSLQSVPVDAPIRSKLLLTVEDAPLHEGAMTRRPSHSDHLLRDGNK